MAQPPKTTAEHKQDGTYRKERHANCLDAAANLGRPQRPDWLNESQARLWCEITEFLPPQVLCRLDSDSLSLLMTVHRCLDELRPQVEEDPTDRDTRIAFCNYLDQWKSLSALFGLSPQHRAKITLPQPVDDDDPLLNRRSR